MQTDLFVSYLNKQLLNHILWYPDPESVGVDVFNMSWTKLKFYALPPFSLVGKSIFKIIQEKVSGIMVIPWWPTQNWFPIMTVACGLTYHSPTEESHIETTASREQVTSTVPQTPASSHTFIRKGMGNQGLQEEVMDISLMERHSNISLWRDTQTVEKLLLPRRCWSPWYRCEECARFFSMICISKDVGTVVFAQPEMHFLVLSWMRGCQATLSYLDI